MKSGSRIWDMFAPRPVILWVAPEDNPIELEVMYSGNCYNLIKSEEVIGKDGEGNWRSV